MSGQSTEVWVQFATSADLKQFRKWKVSRATATRYLAQLVELKCLQKTAAGGRSTRYVVAS